MRWWTVAMCVFAMAGVGCVFDLDEVQAVPTHGADASLSDGSAETTMGDGGVPDAADGVTWPETTTGNCTNKSECSPGHFCNDVGKCEACTEDWTLTGGGSHCGEDWAPADGDTIAGEHVDVGSFHVGAGFMVQVKAREGTEFGEVVVRARSVRIEGTLSAAGAGHAGGEPGSGGPSTAAGATGGLGAGDQGAPPGGPGSGGGSDCIPVAKEPHSPGGNGATGSAGGYGTAAANGDSCQAPRILVGSGGGGGGGAGGGQRSTCCSLSVAGGVGGSGGQGGRGGGAISLFARDDLVLSGHVLATGLAGSVGQSGAEGASESKKDPESSLCGPCGGCADHRYAYCPGMGPCGSAQNDCCQRPCCFYYVGGPGGKGGSGGPGAGGGVLLQASSVQISGFIDVLGGGNEPTNGGTVSIQHQGAAPSTDGIAAGLICTGTL